MSCTGGTFRTDLDKKKLVENSLFAIRFLSVFFDVFHVHFFGFMVICRLDPKMSRANPAYVSGWIWTVRRDRGLLLFGGHFMVLVVVWWSFAVTWGLVHQYVVNLRALVSAPHVPLTRLAYGLRRTNGAGPRRCTAGVTPASVRTWDRRTEARTDCPGPWRPRSGRPHPSFPGLT